MNVYTAKSAAGHKLLRMVIDGNPSRRAYAQCLRAIRNAESSHQMRQARAWLYWIGYPAKVRL